MLDVRKPSFDEVCDGSDRGSAAVGGEDRAGDVAGLGGGEEDDHAGDLIGLGGAGHEGGRAGGLGHAAEPACPARSSSWAGSPRSAAAKRAVPPAAVMAPATAPPRAGSRPCTMTTAPCRPSCTAAAWPIPDVAPVTRAVRPWRSRCSSLLLSFLVETCVLLVGHHSLRRPPHRAGAGIRARPPSRSPQPVLISAVPAGSPPSRCGAAAGRDGQFPASSGRAAPAMSAMPAPAPAWPVIPHPP